MYSARKPLTKRNLTRKPSIFGFHSLNNLRKNGNVLPQSADSALAEPAAGDIELWMLIHPDLRHTARIRTTTAHLHGNAAIAEHLGD